MIGRFLWRYMKWQVGVRSIVQSSRNLKREVSVNSFLPHTLSIDIYQGIHLKKDRWRFSVRAFHWRSEIFTSRRAPRALDFQTNIGSTADWTAQVLSDSIHPFQNNIRWYSFTDPSISRRKKKKSWSAERNDYRSVAYPVRAQVFYIRSHYHSFLFSCIYLPLFCWSINMYTIPTYVPSRCH